MMVVQSEKLAKVLARAIVDNDFRESFLMFPRQTLDENDVSVPEELAIRIEHGHMTGTIETSTEYVIHLPEKVDPIGLEEVENLSIAYNYGSTVALPLCAVYLED